MNNAPGKLTSRDRQRIDTRNRVFKAALAEFRRVGVAEARVEPIVGKARVSVGTYYRYFPGKDDVLLELLRRQMTDLATQIEAKIHGRRIGLRTMLKTTVDLLFDLYRQEDERLVREIFSLLVRRAPVDVDWVSLPLLQPIIALLHEERSRGRSSSHGDPAAADLARIFFSAILGFLAGMHPDRHRQAAHEFVDIFLRGIR